MPIGTRFEHTVTILRPTVTGSYDDYGHPTDTEGDLLTVKAAIQPKDARELALISQSGAGLSDHTIFMFPTDVTGADAIFHDQGDCPLVNDLPHMRFEIEAIHNAAGKGHHLEIDARAIQGIADVTGS